MDANQDVAITPPLLPKGGGAVQTIGQSWSAASGMGTASFEVPLPVSPCRTSAPAMVLSYRNLLGNGLFGVGWSVGVPMIRRRTSHGVPAYDDTDTFLAPDDQWLVPDQDANGAPIVEQVATYGDHELDAVYTVQRFRRRVDTAGDLIERWTPPAGSGSPFWLIHGANGMLYLFGKSSNARLADPDPAKPDHVAEWYLQESLTPLGEHVVYDYAPEDGAGIPVEQAGRDAVSARYLWRVRYGNTAGSPSLYAWDGEAACDAVDWQFELIFDYGQRSLDAWDVPGYASERAWPLRSDPFSHFAYGFEHRILRLCRQVLMYHRFQPLGVEPQLVRRTLFDYEHSPYLTRLIGMQFMAYDAYGDVEYAPPLDFGWNSFDPRSGDYHPFPAMPGLDEGIQTQLVDLYGEGMAGVLYRDDAIWLYREPQRETGTEDGVVYAKPAPLPVLPSVRGQDYVREPWRGPSSMRGYFSLATRRMLMDHTGDGRLDWVIVDPALNGFFTVNPDRTWSSFIPFAAVPGEFLHAQARLADVAGAGLTDLVLIGPRSVRLYPNRRKRGFGTPVHVPQDDTLPLSGGTNEIVAFADVLGSGQQHLVRIRSDGVECWPNLGHGRFGKRLHLADIDFGEEPFDPSCVFLADLDGSGAVDLLYATSCELKIFQNRSGHGFDTAVARAWPAGLRYDRTWSISFADVAGLGCASVIITTPHGSDGSLQPRHWRLDFVTAKPHLMAWTNNNCGCETRVVYRSSAQEWLDEKAESAPGRIAVSRLPFPMHLVKCLTRHDEISGNAAHAISSYRGGYYDGEERQFRSFAQHIVREEGAPGGHDGVSDAAPVILTKTWYHVGDATIDNDRSGFDRSDPDAVWPGPPLLTYWDAAAGTDVVAEHVGEHEKRELWRALAGAVRRVEVFGLDGSEHETFPYTVSENRYWLRQVEPPRHGRMHGVCMSMNAEQVVYTYERTPSDSRRDCSIVLRRDMFGHPLQSVSIACARPHAEPPFDDAEAVKYWRSSHDEQQDAHHVAETLEAPWHLTNTQAWRLALPGDVRENAATVNSRQWSIHDMSHECLSAPDSVLGSLDRGLVSYRRWTYGEESTRPSVPFHGLVKEVATAALDAAAYAEYARVLSEEDLQTYLDRGGYEPMHGRLLEPDEILWGTVSGISAYASLELFYRPYATAPCRTVGITLLEYDASGLFIEKITSPDGLVVTMRHDYRQLQPWSVTDGNDNVHEVRLDAFGRVRATSFRGKEHDATHQPVDRGFKPLSEWSLPNDTLPGWGMEHPRSAVQGSATVHLSDTHAWMGRLRSDGSPFGTDLRDDWLTRRWITATGHVRALGRLASRHGDKRAEALADISRQPMHVASFAADRYPGEEDGSIQTAVSYSDGFGRLLQTKRLVAPGEAWRTVGASGEKTAPSKIHVTERWAVAERVTYHDRGFPVRAYRPYFSDTWRYTSEASLGGAIHFDSYFYDALGRVTSTLNASGGLQKTTFHAWYTVSEDENQMAAGDDPGAPRRGSE